jgi:hypothetical protein
MTSLEAHLYEQLFKTKKKVSKNKLISSISAHSMTLKQPSCGNLILFFGHVFMESFIPQRHHEPEP